MATEIGRLIAIFEGDDRKYHAARKRVESGGRQTADTLIRDEKRLTHTKSQLERQVAADIRRFERERRQIAEQNSRAIIAMAKREADARIREGRRAANAVIAELKRESRQRAGAGGTVGIGGLAAGAAGGVAALLGVSAVSQIRAAGAAWFDYSSKLEATRIAFTTMLGSSRAAEAHLRELQQFALTTPFEFQDLVEASQRMQALGFTANQVVPLLRDVGNAVAAAGGGSERLDRVVLALSQIQSKGKVATQEMNQLAESGIPAWKMLEQQLGKSRGELVKLVEQGKITSDTFLKAFQQFSQNNFGDLMEKQSKTAIGALSNLKDAIMQIADQALQPLFDLARRGLLELSNNLLANQSSWVAWGRQISSSVAEGISSIALLIKTVKDLDREIAEASGLSTLSKMMHDEAKRLESERAQAIVGGLALLNSLRGGAATKGGQRWEDAGEFAIAGSIPAEAQAKPTRPTGGGGGGGGGRARAARDVLADIKRSLEMGLRTTLETLRIEEEGVERSYENRRLAVASYARAAQQLERKRHEEVISTLAEETKLAQKIKDPAERKIALEELGLRKIEERNRHTRETWRLEDQIKNVTRERIALVETLTQRLTREREVLKQIAQERLRFASEIARQDLGGGSFVLTPDLRDSIGRSRVATVERHVEDERLQIIRERMRELASDLTGILDRAVYDGVEGGLTRGFQSFFQGILQRLLSVAMQRLENELANVLGSLATGGASGGRGGWIFDRLISPILGALGGGFGGGRGAAGGLGSGIAGAIGRQSGGPIWPNQLYQVHKDELIIPTAPGFVVPKGAQQTVVHNHYNTFNIKSSPDSYQSPRSAKQISDKIVAALQAAQT